MRTNLFAGLNGAARGVLMFAVSLMLMGLPLYAVPEPGGESPPQDLSVEQILDRHYEAIGGDHHQSVQSMSMTGTAVVMGMESGFTRYAKRPDKMALEIYVQGMTGVQAFDGETAWWFMPFMGQTAAEVMPPDMALATLEGAEFDGPLVDPAGKGHQVELQGIEVVNDSDAYKLQVTMASGGVQTHYIDAETFLTSRVESSTGDAVFLDYRVIDGHPVPHLIEMMGQMGEQVIYVESVEFNVELDDALFRMQ